MKKLLIIQEIIKGEIHENFGYCPRDNDRFDAMLVERQNLLDALKITDYPAYVNFVDNIM